MLEKIEEYAKINNVPIMQKDGIEYLCNLIKEKKIKRILEIGSAIGYSAVKMALVDKDIKVVTIEKDIDRYNEAVKNIKLFNLDKQIDIILDDALNTKIDDEFDLIFIDASKGNNINFFNKYKENLAKNGIIVTDNLSFHGLVENPELAITRNQRGLVKRINSFIDFLDNNHEFITEYVSVGDKISISQRGDIHEV